MKGAFGFIHEKLDIKILILFILRRLSEPAPFELLTELTMCDDGISYFDYVDCLADLTKTEHIKVENNSYTISEKGKRNGEITESSLPYTVRRKAENSVFLLRGKQNRNAMIKTSHCAKEEGGYSVMLTLSDGIGDIFSIELFAADEKHALAMEKGFRKNAENIFNAMVGMMLT